MTGSGISSVRRLGALVVLALALHSHAAAAGPPSLLDRELAAVLEAHGFTGRVAETLEARLGRHIDHGLADVGRLLWFDTIGGLNGDNTCGGCHSPTTGF